VIIGIGAFSYILIELLYLMMAYKNNLCTFDNK